MPSASTRRLAKNDSNTKSCGLVASGVGACGSKKSPDKTKIRIDRTRVWRQIQIMNCMKPKNDQRFRLTRATFKSLCDSPNGLNCWKRAWHSLLIEVKIADRFACRRVLGLFHRLFKFLCQDVFLVGLLEPGVREFVFALAVLFRKDLLSVAQVHIRASLDGRFMRKHGTENGVNSQLCLAARAREVEVLAGTVSHKLILLPLAARRKRVRGRKSIAVGNLVLPG